LALALAGGCKKKQDDKGATAATGSGTATATGAATGGGGGAGGAGNTSATTEALGELKPVNECPPALQGSDTGLARTIPAGCTTVVEGEYYVEKGTLVVEAGATLKFKPDAALYVAYNGAAKLEVRGTKEKPVTFTTAGDAAAGVWKGVHLYPRAARSKLSWLTVDYAVKSLEVEAPDVTIEDSTFRNAKEIGVMLHASVPAGSFARNTLDKVEGSNVMSLPPDAMFGFGGGNAFPPGSTIELRAGNTAQSGTWQSPGAKLRVTGEVYVEGKAGRAAVEIAAGTVFAFDSTAGFYVGYSGEGEVRVKGTADAPVVFGAAGDQAPGSWDRGFVAYSRGTVALEHAVFEHGGREKSGALRGEGGKLSVSSTVFKNNVVGLSIDDATELKAFDGNELTGNTESALVVYPRHLGSLGAANKYAANQKVEVQGGRVEKAVTWALQAEAAVNVVGEVYIEGSGSVTVPAGATYAFSDSGALYVGYSSDGTLIVQGTKDKPVTFAGVRDEEGAWKGIELYARARASVLEHVVVKNTGEAAGVRASGEATVKVDGLTCAKCAGAALRWDCNSKVTQSGVKAEGGTPKATLAPEGC
jgi:hypothetical protein